MKGFINMKQMLITGGAGFIGSNFIHYILSKYNDYQVINLDKLTYAANLDNLKDIEDNKNYRFIHGDIADQEFIFKLFEKTEGLTVYDNLTELKYPTALDVSGKDDVYVGRIRRDFSLDNGLNLWVVADNIRKGAALNAVQIAEVLIKNEWL